MYQNILVVRTDRIGDVVLTTPSLHALRKKFPAAKISVLLSPSTRDLVEGNPDVDNVFFDDRGGRHKGGGGYLRLIREIRQRRFDLAIVYHTKKRTNLLCWAAGIPARMGYKNNKLGFLLNIPLRDGRPSGKKHEARYCLDVLEKLDITGAPLDLHVPTRPDNDAWADNWLRDRRILPGHFIAVAPSASCPTRQWPVIRFVELIPLLQSRLKLPTVIVGGPESRRIAAEIQSAVPDALHNLTGETTLGKFVSLLKQSALLVSNDSGPVHIAAALGTPVVSVFTRNQPGINPERWKPLGEKSVYVAPAEDMSISFAKGEVTDPAFLYAVTAQDVLRAVDALFKLC